MNLAEIAELTGGLDRAAFGTKHPNPALLFMTGEIDGAADGKSPRPVDETAEFKTTMRIAASLPGAPILDPEAPLVFLVKRSTWTPFDDVITVGRATVQDVCIAKPSVSKFHACITRFPNNGWRITDQRAANGTFVDGKKLAAGGSAALADGTHVGFGPGVEALFYTPAGLHAVLERFRAGT